MIIPLKKVDIISTEKPEQIIEILGTINLVHIKTKVAKIAAPVIERKLIAVEKAKKIISLKNSKYSKHITDIEIAIDEINILAEKEEKLEKQIAYMKEEESFYELFGKEIQLSDLIIIKKSGVDLKFYQTDKNDIISNFLSFEKHGNEIIGISENFISDEKEYVLPTLEYADVLKTLKELEQNKISLLSEFDNIGNCFQELEEYKNDLVNRLLILEMSASSLQLEGIPVYIISGFINSKEQELFEASAEKNNFAYFISNPTEEDEPPVLLSNPKIVENIIYPIYDFMGSWPSPFGKDPSHMFALFLIIFGSILIGDAGYGLVLISTGFIFRKKINLPIIYYLGVGCIIWGSLCGTWFGNAWLIVHTPLKYLVVPDLSSYIVTTGELNTEIQGTIKLMFLIGGIHLTIAKLMAISKNLSQNIEVFGEISLIWGMVFVVRALIAGDKNTSMIAPLFITGLIIGIVGILIRKESIGSKIFAILAKPIGIINNFADTMSYIRLFAVGFASLIVAMVGSLIASIIPGYIPGALVFLLMNGINLSLGLIAILVHAVRLNNLEFTNNAGLNLNGKKFLPFYLKNIKNREE